ncbi:MAG: tetratricopeptide repeat protein [Psychroserpens sp.]|uniref:tetratricopeptide repeat protein n=1 Tax=Psychroserpens sp. TaxID=2020870 RepID=UPI003CB66E55
MNNNNISQELLESVERYYHDTMSRQERLDFEYRLENDDVFQTQVEDIQTLILGIENQSLKEQLDVFHEGLPEGISEEKRGSFTFPNLKIYVSAAVILLAVALLWVYSVPQNERLYADYFSPDPGLPTTMSTSNDYAFYDAMVNYKQGDYEKAIAKWEVLQKNQPENDTLNYFLGVAQLANKKEPLAIDYLKSVTKDSQSRFRNEAYYYLGLGYLKANNVEMAKKNFSDSSEEKAKEILKKLND